MARANRILDDGVPYHITQRGNHRQAVFLTDVDRLWFLDLLAGSCMKHRISIIGYCLMPNHVHLLLIPERGRALSKAMARTFHQHAIHINKIRATMGHLWQARFYSGALDAPGIWTALRYVEVNPVAAKLVQSPEDWRWSSTRAHLGLGDPLGILDDRLWHGEFTIARWRQWLETPTMADITYEERLAEAIRAGKF